mmetsp:Transcript_76707/g.89128  ORF Transcript_76707/g.89128 Transcript_76707/m.89128 type:complete len:428 (+) Transcript_76707:33-1316(+)
MEGLKEKKIVIDAKTPKQLQQPMFNRKAYIMGGKLPGNKPSHRNRQEIEHRPRMEIESSENIKAKPMDTVPSLLNYIMDTSNPRNYKSYYQYLDEEDVKLPAMGLKSFPWEGVTSECLGKFFFEKNIPNSLCWMPSGRKLLCGSSKGELLRLNGTTLKLDDSRVVHEEALKAIKIKRDNKMFITADKKGVIKYFDENLKETNRIDKEEDSHKEPVKEITLCFTDLKFASCSEDKTLKIWDIETRKAEKTLHGHVSDVITCDWHPYKGLIASGSKDASIKFWDPNCENTEKGLFTIYNHNKAVTNVRFNRNGNWLLSSSRDHRIKLYDIRMLKELQSFRGESTEVGEVEVIAWHPVHERLFVSGDSDGNLAYWLAFESSMLYLQQDAHKKTKVIDISWNPIGNVLATCGHDKTVKFWGRPNGTSLGES